MHRILRTDCLIAICAAVLLCFGVLPAEAARIQVDAVSSGSGTANSTYTLSHTVAVTTNRLLIVGASVEDDGPGDCSISSITYNSVGMSEVKHQTPPPMPPFTCATNYYLLAPATGTNNVVVTWSGTVDAFVVGAMSLYGVKQAAPADFTGNFSSSGTTISSTANVATKGAAIIDVVTYSSSGALTPDGSQVEKYDVDSGSHRGAMSILIMTTAAETQSVGWTGTDGDAKTHAIGVFTPFIGQVLPLTGTP